MKSYRLTPAARGDLSSIWDFTKEHWGETQAEIYIREMRAAIENRHAGTSGSGQK